MIPPRSQSCRRSPYGHSAAIVALCVVPFVSACFTYAPIEPGDIQPGMSVRARISPTARERIAPLLGSTDPRPLTGTLISSTTDTLIVEVPTASDGVSVNQILHQRVSIARGEIRELESRKLDRMKTALLAGAGAAIVISVIVKVMQGNPASEPLPGGGGTDDIVPLFHVRP